MKKYYNLVGRKIVACLDWKEGYGSLEDAKKHLSGEIREISLKEFNKLGKEYSEGR